MYDGVGGLHSVAVVAAAILECPPFWIFDIPVAISGRPFWKCAELLFIKGLRLVSALPLPPLGNWLSFTTIELARAGSEPSWGGCEVEVAEWFAFVLNWLTELSEKNKQALFVGRRRRRSNAFHQDKINYAGAEGMPFNGFAWVNPETVLRMQPSGRKDFICVQLRKENRRIKENVNAMQENKAEKTKSDEGAVREEAFITDTPSL